MLPSEVEALWEKLINWQYPTQGHFQTLGMWETITSTAIESNQTQDSSFPQANALAVLLFLPFLVIYGIVSPRQSNPPLVVVVWKTSQLLGHRPEQLCISFKIKAIVKRILHTSVDWWYSMLRAVVYVHVTTLSRARDTGPDRVRQLTDWMTCLIRVHTNVLFRRPTRGIATMTYLMLLIIVIRFYNNSRIPPLDYMRKCLCIILKRCVTLGIQYLCRIG